MPILDREEYIEQAYFFRALRERMQQGVSAQELLASLRHEILTITKLPLAIDFMATELRHTGGFAGAMRRLSHYFTPFQTFVMAEAERPEGKFDLRIGLEVLEKEADYRAKGATPQGLFLYQFEALCRNRLGYDEGLHAIAQDPMYDGAWQEWIQTVRRQIGLVDIADMIYVRSEEYLKTHEHPGKPILFGEKEGKIALANRHRDPLYLFSALSRQLGYPSVPRPRPEDAAPQLVPQLMRRVERLETRIKLLEEELRGGIDISRFFGPPKPESGG